MDLRSKMVWFGLVPVLKIEQSEGASCLSEALLEGRLPCAEITFRKEATEESIQIIPFALPEITKLIEYPRDDIECPRDRIRGGLFGF